MKILKTSEGFNILCDNQTEKEQLEMFQSSIRSAVPKLIKLWQKEIIEVSTFSELAKLIGDNSFHGNLRQLLISGVGTPLAMRERGHSGRPIQKRVISASFRLLLGEPYEMVLKQESSGAPKSTWAQSKTK